MTRKCHVRFGGGLTEKARQRDLAGGLPYYRGDAEALKSCLGVVHRLVGLMVKLLGLVHPPKESEASLTAVAAD